MSSGIHLVAILQEIPQLSVTEIGWKITYLKFCSNLSGANELKLQPHLPGDNELTTVSLILFVISSRLGPWVHWPTNWGPNTLCVVLFPKLNTFQVSGKSIIVVNPNVQSDMILWSSLDVICPIITPCYTQHGADEGRIWATLCMGRTVLLLKPPQNLHHRRGAYSGT